MLLDQNLVKKNVFNSNTNGGRSQGKYFQNSHRFHNLEFFVYVALWKEEIKQVLHFVLGLWHKSSLTCLTRQQFLKKEDFCCLYMEIYYWVMEITEVKEPDPVSTENKFLYETWGNSISLLFFILFFSESAKYPKKLIVGMPWSLMPRTQLKHLPLNPTNKTFIAEIQSECLIRVDKWY